MITNWDPFAQYLCLLYFFCLCCLYGFKRLTSATVSLVALPASCFVFMVAKLITNEQVALARSQVHVSSDNQEKAERALRNLAVEETHDNVILWLTLSMLLGSEGRITKKLWSQHQVKVVCSVATEVSYYQVLRTDMPNLPPQAAGRVVDPRSIPDFPAGIPPNTVWFLKKSFPKELLPNDYSKIRTSASTVRELPVSVSGLTGHDDNRS